MKLYGRFHYLNAMINSTKITLDRARLEEQGDSFLSCRAELNACRR